MHAGGRLVSVSQGTGLRVAPAVLPLIKFKRVAFHLSDSAQGQVYWITRSPVEYKEWKESTLGLSSVAVSLAVYSFFG